MLSISIFRLLLAFMELPFISWHQAFFLIFITQNIRLELIHPLLTLLTISLRHQHVFTIWPLALLEQRCEPITLTR